MHFILSGFEQLESLILNSCSCGVLYISLKPALSQLIFFMVCDQQHLSEMYDFKDLD